MFKLLYKLSGWKISGEIPDEIHRCVLVCAPHTSNWDFYFAVLVMKAQGIPYKAAIKNFWTKFPFGLIIKPLGGVGIERKKTNPKLHQVDMLAELFERYQDIALLITPEGTRSLRTKWKTGFYYIAKEAGVPIIPGSADYAKKEIIFGKAYTDLSDKDAILKDMMQFFNGVAGKHPELYSPDLRYV